MKVNVSIQCDKWNMSRDTHEMGENVSVRQKTYSRTEDMWERHSP